MPRAGWLVLACALAACSRGGDDANAKQWQATPPPPKIEVPQGLAIAVTVDGQGRAPITTDTLSTVKPDFVDDEHRVWLVATLVPEAGRPAATTEASEPGGMSVRLARTPEGYVPALFLSRRGELKVGMIDPKEPFPKWHGQGGRLHRPGDSLPHVGPVAKLAITLAPTP